MKNTLLFLAFLFLGITSYGQNVNVPDDNFEAYLETHNANGDIVALGASDSMGNGVLNDNTVPTSRIENVTSLDVNTQNIADLMGIAGFSALTGLDCSYNALTTLDVSTNTALTNLSCIDNALTTLDVSANTALTGLYCYFNALATLNVSTNTALTSLFCHGNPLTTLDVSSNTALTFLNCMDAALATLDVSTNTALTSLLCLGNALTTLDISANTALTNLSCGENDLTTLDVSNNTALTSLQCHINDLSTLNVSSNTALTQLLCYGNTLTALDVSTNTTLTTLWCFSNALTTLDLSTNTALTFLFCYSNALNTLDLRNIPVSQIPTANFKAYGNPNLTCIFTDDVAAAETNWTNIDAASTFVVDEAACQALDIADIESLGFTYYPNPTTDVLYLSAQENINQLTIYNMLGQEVKNNRPLMPNFTLDVSNLSAGTYFIKAQVGNQVGTFKFIKK